MNMKKKQRPLRKSPDRTVDVIDQMTGERTGHIGNLSATGMMLIAERPIADDALYQFSFALPGVSTRRTIEVGAHEQWTAPGARQGQQWVGLHFIDISDEDEQALQRWLADGSEEE